MSLYNKIVPDIVQSSIWNQPSDIRIVWITLIALKDSRGYVRGDFQTISRLANVPEDVTKNALHLFQQPDLSSHTPDHDGRRIAPAPGGWMILNHYRYTEIGMSEANKAYWRKKKAEQREQSKTCLGHVQDNAGHVSEASTSASLSVSSSLSGKGVQGETKPEAREGIKVTYIGPVTVREGLLGLVDRIKTCRPEYGNMRENDIVAILNGNSDTKSVGQVIVDWCVEQANAMTPMGNPIASLRKRIAAIGEAADKNPYAKWAKDGGQ